MPLAGADRANLRAPIALTSDETEVPIEARGTLVGGDITSRTFHFVVPYGPDYRGKLSPKFLDDVSLELGREYTANITSYVKTIYARNEEQVRFELERLRTV